MLFVFEAVFHVIRLALSYIIVDDFESLLLLPLSECWVDKCSPPCHVYVMRGIKLRALYILRQELYKLSPILHTNICICNKIIYRNWLYDMYIIKFERLVLKIFVPYGNACSRERRGSSERSKLESWWTQGVPVRTHRIRSALCFLGSHRRVGWKRADLRSKSLGELHMLACAWNLSSFRCWGKRIAESMSRDQSRQYSKNQSQINKTATLRLKEKKEWESVMLKEEFFFFNVFVWKAKSVERLIRRAAESVLGCVVLKQGTAGGYCNYQNCDI